MSHTTSYRELSKTGSGSPEKALLVEEEKRSIEGENVPFWRSEKKKIKVMILYK